MSRNPAPSLSDQELKELLKAGEGERVERCESPTDKDKIAKAICAFSNDMAGSGKSGVIFIGVKDNGECAKLSVTDQMLLKIASIKDDGNLQPFPVMSVNKKNFDSCEIIVVEAQPSKHPPMRYKGSCWIRTGPSTRRASAEDEERLIEKRRAIDLPEDMRGFSDAKMEDLNGDYFKSHYLPTAVSPEVLKENDRDLKKQMRSLNFLDHEFAPTMTAILILGVNPRNWLPEAYIQFVRFDGQELTDPVKSQKEISGPLPEQIIRIEEIFKANISTALKLGDGRNLQSPDYPLTALSQLARNAVIHRNYKSHTLIRIHWFSDRVEIQSPGGPYGELNVENFGQEGITAYRNPTIASALKNLGFVERFGFGLPQARKALEENGNPKLELKADPAFILAVLKKAHNSSK